jgi:hypothetical protein
MLGYTAYRGSIWVQSTMGTFMPGKSYHSPAISSLCCLSHPQGAPSRGREMAAGLPGGSGAVSLPTLQSHAKLGAFNIPGGLF